MDKRKQAIIEDLLPLYNEGLLSPETTAWLEEQIQDNQELQKLMDQAMTPLEKDKIESPVQHDKMIITIKRRLALYQLIFIGLSFFLAIQTSMLNESFGFILWYAVLGLLTYLFYKDMKIVFYISFIPIFIWSLGGNIGDFLQGDMGSTVSFGQFFLQSVMGSILVTLIHYLFAFIGSMIGFLYLKIRIGEDK
ncbi:hypothetical protein E1I69_04930 [Bacillus timonensis]|uniref:Uncharacterized protein n=1 Tax=Bacillus timonensis TaxID=1033734 RepID=A0A4S3PWD6_9BACI|nr:hypothetical protein [Bacillus timonensis]THE14159.1 hypothetical protein E1I69_04930 [Bacillus timonensis]